MRPLSLYWFGVLCRIIYYLSHIIFLGGILSIYFGCAILIAYSCGEPSCEINQIHGMGLLLSGILLCYLTKRLIEYGKHYLHFEQCEKGLDFNSSLPENLQLSKTQIELAYAIVEKIKEINTTTSWERQSLRKELKGLLLIDPKVNQELLLLNVELPKYLY